METFKTCLQLYNYIHDHDFLPGSHALCTYILAAMVT